MALTKEQKAKLMDLYQDTIGKASNVVLLVQNGIPVNAVNQVRMNMDETGGRMLVVKKRLFLKSSEKAGLDQSDLEKIKGHLTVLFAFDDEYAPLKLINKMNKQYKKEGAEYSFEYLGGWYDKSWKDAAFVSEMASLPTKEELIGKLLFLLKHPIQKLTGTLDQIKEKLEKEGGAEAKAEEAPAEKVAEPVKEEKQEETAEPKAEEVTEAKEEPKAVEAEGDAEVKEEAKEEKSEEKKEDSAEEPKAE